MGRTSSSWPTASGHITSGGTAAPDRLNDKLVGSFADAVVADFNGNGISDIAFSDGQNWRYSPDGPRYPLAWLRDGEGILGLSSTAYPPLKELLVGQFDSDPAAEVISLDRKVVYRDGFHQDHYGPGDQLILWRGLGTGNLFIPHSQQNMR